METNINHTQGDTLFRSLIFKDSDGDVINITGAVIKMTIRTTPDADITLQATATLTDAANGLAEINFTGSQMEIDLGQYYYDIEYTDTDGQITTIIKGFLFITFDVT